MSDTTTIFTDSARSSLVSPGKPKYPSIVIPHRDSWGSMTGSLKDAAFGMSPVSKIPLSPEALSAIPNWAPLINTTPSLGASSSVTSESPSMPALSAPATPETRQLHLEDEDNWHEQHENAGIAVEIPEQHVPLHLAPVRHSIVQSETGWSDIVRHFPRIPGATPELNTPVTPAVRRMVDYLDSPVSEAGVQLPDEALRTLQRLVRDSSPTGNSDKTRSEREEMREGLQPPSRPRSEVGLTPISEYSEHSFSQLSIPSPGGFFASLGAGTRHTWSFGNSKYVPPPSSATAENFYGAPWNQPETARETVVEVSDSNTDGPPTARQAEFNVEVKSRKTSRSDPSSETSDMYGAPSDTSGASTIPAQQGEARHEYEEAYDEELKQAAEAHMDRTSTWLAAQNTYLAVLRETNPVNDLSDPSSLQLATVHNQVGSEIASTKLAPVRNKSVRFDAGVKSPQHKVVKVPLRKDPILLEALQHHMRNWRTRDSFAAASARLSLIQSLRTVSPNAHLSRYLHGALRPPQSSFNNRPKYSGPFSQNPRQTCLLGQPPSIERMAFNTIELQQSALQTIQPHTWTVDALRYLYSGRLLASQDVCDRLTTKATIPLTSPECIGRKRVRVLDLGSVPSDASWAWQVALKWPNVKVYSVLTKEQAKAARPTVNTNVGPNAQIPHTNGASTSTTPASSPTDSDEDRVKSASPPNHRTTTVPHFYSLPFRTGTFDVVRAHSLHALLKSEPVPGVTNIDEFDMTLKEIMRVLKPGGVLDFMVMDSGIKGSGPLGEKTSVEFGFLLRGMGYARDVTRTWIGRLHRTGFVGIKRAWWAAPLGKAPLGENLRLEASGRDGGKTWKEAPRPLSDVSVRRILDEYMHVEAVQGPVGCTSDVADVTGLLGGWMWESWVVRVREESARRKAGITKAAAASRSSQISNTTAAESASVMSQATTSATAPVDETKVLDGIAEVLEEGRRTGACWRMLSGWARKPRKPSQHAGKAPQHKARRGKVPTNPPAGHPPDPPRPSTSEGPREMAERVSPSLIRHSYDSSLSLPPAFLNGATLPDDAHYEPQMTSLTTAALSRSGTTSTTRSSALQSVELSLDLSSEPSLTSDGEPTPRQIDFQMLTGPRAAPPSHAQSARSQQYGSAASSSSSSSAPSPGGHVDPLRAHPSATTPTLSFPAAHALLGPVPGPPPPPPPRTSSSRHAGWPSNAHAHAYPSRPTHHHHHPPPPTMPVVHHPGYQSQSQLLQLRQSHIHAALLSHSPGALSSPVSPEEGAGTMSSLASNESGATWIGEGVRREDSRTGTIRVAIVN